MKGAGKGKVLVLGNDTRSFLAVIRSLGRKGVEVQIGWCEAKAAARYSRYITKIHEIPQYSRHSAAWKDALIKILDEEKFKLVIPCNDPSILPLQFNRRELEPFAPLYLLDSRTFELTSDKHRMYEVARSLGIPVPNGLVVTNPEDVNGLTEVLGLPLVLKPFSSYTEDNVSHRHEVKKAFTADRLRELARQMTKEGPIVVQEHVHGVGMGVELIADKGKILTVFQHLRVHEPVHGGGGSYRVSAKVDPELYGAVERLVRALSYTGVAMVEFKMNTETGRWVFLEMNARFWGSLPLAVASGMDFPWYLYQMMVAGRQEFNKEYRKGLFCRNLVSDIEWFRDNLKADHSNPLLHTVPVGKVILELGHLLSFRERSDTFTIDDPLPGFVELYHWLKNRIGGLRRKARLSIRSLGISRVMARRRAARLASETKNIVFACKGNICRSPFASLYARTLFKDEFSISSYGLSAAEGKRCPAVAQEAARSLGVELADHQAAAMTKTALQEAGVVFVFDNDNHEALNERFDPIASKIVFLGVFLPRGPIVIDDPDGGDLETFVRTYRAVVEALSAFKAHVARRTLSASIGIVRSRTKGRLVSPRTGETPVCPPGANSRTRLGD